MDLWERVGRKELDVFVEQMHVQDCACVDRATVSECMGV